MTIGVVLLALSMGLDVFAGGLALGIAGLPRPRWTRTAAAFALFGVVLLALGVLFGRLLSDTLGSVASYLAGGLLLVLGLRAIGDVILGGYDDESTPRSLDPKSVLLTGLVVSLDKLAVGVALAVVEVSLGPVLAYFAVQGFLATLAGLWLGKRLGSRLGDAAHLVAGGVFVVLGAIIVYQTAANRAMLS
jgi:putative Mn2+ efflux pump MntP